MKIREYIRMLKEWEHTKSIKLATEICEHMVEDLKVAERQQ